MQTGIHQPDSNSESDTSMKRDKTTSYSSPKLEVQPSREFGGRGLYATELIREGELLAVWGGDVFTRQELDDYPEEVTTHSIQVEEDIFIGPIKIGEDPADFFNHSCNPNGWLVGQIVLVAMRDIQTGEEVCFDYATSDGSDYDEFECLCGQPNCRKRITCNDWMRPELHERYQGHFSPYLQRRIDHLKNGKAVKVEVEKTVEPCNC